MLIISLIIFGIGAVIAGLGGFSFYFRAITNKKAWDGKTKPLILIGTIFLVIGLIMIYLTY